MRGPIFVSVFIITHVILDSAYSKERYEVILENVTSCGYPHPPYAKKRMFLSYFELRKENNITLLSGQHRVLVLADIPFTNYSINAKKLVSGKKEPLFYMDKLNCRSWMGKMFLTVSKFRYINKGCILKKGSYEFRDYDLDKAAHTIPHWYSAGRQLHTSSLVHNGSTVFCVDIIVSIKEFS